MKKHFVLFVLVIVTLVNSCSLFLFDEVTGFEDQILQGTVRNSSFEFVAGYATTNLYDPDKYSIYLFPSEPSVGYEAWNLNAYGDIYPYLTFSIDINSGPQTYDISLFGSNSIVLTGYSNSYDGTWFDDGQLEITEIDTINHRISGRIWATTNEKTSSVTGDFEVIIEH